MEKKDEIIVLNKQDLTNSYQKVKTALPKYWDRDFINKQLGLISNSQHRMLMTYLWRSGVRISEAISLRKKDIDFEGYLMTVRWLKSRKYNDRVLPIHPALRDLLQLYAAGLKAEDRLFPITRQRAWQLTKKYFGGHPHQLRHSFAVNWLRCSGDLVILH